MANNIKIGIVVNDVAKLDLGLNMVIKSTIEALKRDHKVFLMGIGDLYFDGDEKVYSKAVSVPKKDYKVLDLFIEDILNLEKEKRETLCVSELDVLLLRFDPSLEPQDRSWARSIGVDFGNLATKDGVIVLNTPEGLNKSRNKLYLQHFPEMIRPQSIITRDKDEIKKFFLENKKIIIKPLSGSEGRNVFFVHDKELSNLEQIIEAVAKEGYIIVQEYLPEVEKGDIRLFLMNGKPLKRGKSFAAFKRVSKGKDVRNNISAGGKPKKAKITKKMLDICEMIKPRLIQDGMFLVGLDIVGDKIIEINVFCPDGFQNIENVTGIDFSKEIIDALERKVEYRDYYNSRFDNNELATF